MGSVSTKYFMKKNHMEYCFPFLFQNETSFDFLENNLHLLMFLHENLEGWYDVIVTLIKSLI